MGNVNHVWVRPWTQVSNPHCAPYQLCNLRVVLSLIGPQFSRLQKGDNSTPCCIGSL